MLPKINYAVRKYEAAVLQLSPLPDNNVNLIIMEQPLWMVCHQLVSNCNCSYHQLTFVQWCALLGLVCTRTVSQLFTAPQSVWIISLISQCLLETSCAHVMLVPSLSLLSPGLLPCLPRIELVVSCNKHFFKVTRQLKKNQVNYSVFNFSSLMLLGRGQKCS